MGWVRGLLLLLTTSGASGQSFPVDMTINPFSGSCLGTDDYDFNFAPAEFTDDFPQSLPRCSGFPQVYHTDDEAYRICGKMTEVAAQRVCWSTGRNLDNSRTIRTANCYPVQRPIADDGTNYANIQGEGDPAEFSLRPKWDPGCRGSAPHPDNAACFGDCYDNVYTAVGYAALEGSALIEGAGADDCELGDDGVNIAANDRIIAGVVCFGINECVEGVLYECKGEFNEDCKKSEQACAANAECTDTDDAFTCACALGYEAGSEGDKYFNGAGCVDIDECADPVMYPCPVGTVCQNTVGSYVCSCNDWKLYSNPDETEEENQCKDITCDALEISNAQEEDIDESTQAETVTVNCKEGYASSIDAEEDSFSLTCRDERWCSCVQPTCQPKPCGDPGSDPNAQHDPTRGLQGDVVRYNCRDGYSYLDADYYERMCQNGVWTNIGAQCQYVNLCGVQPCSTNAVCYPVKGDYVCICRPGYEGNPYATPNGCQKVECGSPPLILNAAKEGNGRQYGDEVTYSCIKGYEVPKALYGGDSTGIVPLFSRFKIYCSKWGKWEPRPIPHCQRINCGYPGTICNADMEGSHFDFEDTVVYTCKKGYRSTGREGPKFFTAECRADRYWTDIYSCEDINECDTNNPCGDTKPGYNGNTCINTPGSYRCVCSYGYNLNSDGNTCTADHGYVGTGGHVGACDWYSSMDLCRYGTCVVDETNRPYCRCNTGYTGPYCDRKNENIFEIIAITALVFGVLAFLIALILIFCLCGFCGPQGGVVAQPEAHIAPVPRPFGWGAMQRLNWRHKPWF